MAAKIEAIQAISNNLAARRINTRHYDTKEGNGHEPKPPEGFCQLLVNPPYELTIN